MTRSTGYIKYYVYQIFIFHYTTNYKSWSNLIFSGRIHSEHLLHFRVTLESFECFNRLVIFMVGGVVADQFSHCINVVFTETRKNICTKSCSNNLLWKFLNHSIALMLAKSNTAKWLLLLLRTLSNSSIRCTLKSVIWRRFLRRNKNECCLLSPGSVSNCAQPSLAIQI